MTALHQPHPLAAKDASRPAPAGHHAALATWLQAGWAWDDFAAIATTLQFVGAAPPAAPGTTLDAAVTRRRERAAQAA